MSLPVTEVIRRKLAVLEATRGHFEASVTSPCYCDHCPENATCEYAFDPYNWSDQDDWCLGEK